MKLKLVLVMILLAVLLAGCASWDSWWGNLICGV